MKKVFSIFLLICLINSLVVLSLAADSSLKKTIVLYDWTNATIDENQSQDYSFTIPVESTIYIKAYKQATSRYEALDIAIVDENGNILQNNHISETSTLDSIIEKRLAQGTYVFRVSSKSFVNGDPYHRQNIKYRFQIIEKIYIDVPAEKLTISKSSITLPQSCKYSLSTHVEPDYCTYATQWSSSNEKVATVDSTGLVRTINDGEASIKAKVGQKEVVCKVNVKKPKQTFNSLTKNNVTLGENATQSYKINAPVDLLAKVFFKESVYGKDATIRIVNAQKQEMFYKSYGYISLLEEAFVELPRGDYTLSITSTSTSSFSCSLKVEGYAFSDIPVTSIKLDKSNCTLSVYDRMQIAASYSPKYTTFSQKWSSSNEKVASVDANGKVWARSFGSAYIYCSMGEKRVKCKIIVSEFIQSFEHISSLKPSALSLYPIVYQNEKKSMKEYFSNVKGLDKAKWTSSNSKIAKVKKGTVYGISSGECDIIATVKKQAYKCRILVPEIKINKSTMNTYVGLKYKLAVLGTSSSVKWSSSNSKVATVSSNGLVKGKNVGKATITGTVNQKTYTCKVNVQKLTYGRIEGTLLYYYNRFYGYRPDAGAKILITDTESVVQYKETFADADGKYSVQVPANRKYHVFIVSENTYKTFSKNVKVKTNETVEVSKKF